ncbi:MAG TPA: hypothetical protein VE085_00885 [Burkholderiales bacterium]|nr:hypothetical protein [Burkholderiales bacterium]
MVAQALGDRRDRRDFMHTTGKGHSQDMIYVTAGGGAAPVKAKVCPNDASGSACAVQSQTLYGLVGGFGAQWQFARHF